MRLPNIFCNCHAYNFKVIAYQIVLYHSAHIISLNQMIWSSMLMTIETNQLRWCQNNSKVLFTYFFCHYICQILVKTAITPKKVTPSFVASPSKNWNHTKILLNLSKRFTLKNYAQFQKNSQTKTKPVVIGYVYYQYVYYEWQEK